MFNKKCLFTASLLFIFIFFASTEDKRYYSIPGHSWAVTVDAAYFTTTENLIDDTAGMRYIKLISPENNFKLIILIEKALNLNKDSPSVAFIKELKSHYNKSVTIKTNEFNDISAIWYSLKNEESYFHLAAFLKYEDFLVSVTFSGAGEEAIFRNSGENIISSLAIITDYLPIIEENLEFGRYYFLKQDFFKALEYFVLLLDDENIYDKLPENGYIDLITMSSSAYSITGSNDIAVNVLKNGIQLLKEEPLFYYNLAAIGAIYYDIDLVFENIELAFFYAAKKNQLHELPDPLDDPSFQIFNTDPANKERLSQIILNAKALM